MGGIQTCAHRINLCALKTSPPTRKEMSLNSPVSRNLASSIPRGAWGGAVIVTL